MKNLFFIYLDIFFNENFTKLWERIKYTKSCENENIFCIIILQNENEILMHLLQLLIILTKIRI